MAMQTAALTAPQNSAHTPGPWAWFGEAGHNSLYLATTHSGRRFVMQFARWGMRGAQPRFQVNSRMVDASELVTFEVCNAVGVSAANKDPNCYRLSIEGINHPDARLIAAAPDLLDALENLLGQLVQGAEFHGITANSPSAQEAIADARAAIRKAGT